MEIFGLLKYMLKRQRYQSTEIEYLVLLKSAKNPPTSWKFKWNRVFLSVLLTEKSTKLFLFATASSLWKSQYGLKNYERKKKRRWFSYLFLTFKLLKLHRSLLSFFCKVNCIFFYSFSRYVVIWTMSKSWNLVKYDAIRSSELCRSEPGQAGQHALENSSACCWEMLSRDGSASALQLEERAFQGRHVTSTILPSQAQARKALPGQRGSLLPTAAPHAQSSGVMMAG